eukprot:18635-Heterococcus_DN1.PRE.2
MKRSDTATQLAPATTLTATVCAAAYCETQQPDRRCPLPQLAQLLPVSTLQHARVQTLQQQQQSVHAHLHWLLTAAIYAYIPVLLSNEVDHVLHVLLLAVITDPAGDFLSRVVHVIARLQSHLHNLCGLAVARDHDVNGRQVLIPQVQFPLSDALPELQVPHPDPMCHGKQVADGLAHDEHPGAHVAPPDAAAGVVVGPPEDEVEYEQTERGHQCPDGVGVPGGHKVSVLAAAPLRPLLCCCVPHFCSCQRLCEQGLPLPGAGAAVV